MKHPLSNQLLFHPKTGGVYLSTGIRIHSETKDVLIGYYNVEKPDIEWVRPIGMFYDKVDIDGHELPRFVEVNKTPGLFDRLVMEGKIPDEFKKFGEKDKEGDKGSE